MNKIILLQFFLIFSSMGFIWEFDPAKLNRQVTKGNTILLMYYIPQSDIYRDFLNHYKIIDEQITNLHPQNFIVGKIDCEEYEDYCDENQIENFPTIKINTPLSDDNSKIPTNIIKITSENFHILTEEPILLKLYVPWCGHCRELKPIYDNLSRNPKIKMAEMDCQEEREKCIEMGYGNYPTLLFINKDIEKAVKYTGGKSEKEIIEFIEEQLTGKKVEKEEQPVNQEL